MTERRGMDSKLGRMVLEHTFRGLQLEHTFQGLQLEHTFRGLQLPRKSTGCMVLVNRMMLPRNYTGYRVEGKHSYSEIKIIFI